MFYLRFLCAVPPPSFIVQVPVADDSAAAQIQLAREVCDGVFSDRKGATVPVALFVATEAARKEAAEQLPTVGGAPVVSASILKEGQTFPGGAEAVLVIGPKEAQVRVLLLFALRPEACFQ